jgi:TetR/AcrR family transcriptional regulator
MATKKASRPRNSAQTREIILAAATVEYARKGLDGARVDAIAKRAKANKHLIYLYFGSKDGLFQAVLERAYQSLRAAQNDLKLRELTPLEGVEALVRFTYRAFLDLPEIIPLASSENMHRAQHLKKSKLIREIFDPLPATIEALLERGVRDGTFRTGIDPIEFYVSVVSLCSYHISNQYSLSVLLKTELMAPLRRKRREQHVVDLVLRFVRRAPEAAD